MNHIRVFRVHARGNIRRIQFGGKLYGFDSRYRLCSIGDVWLICGYTVRTRPGLHNAICFGWNIAARKTSGVENEGEREEEFRTDPYAKLCTVLCVHLLYGDYTGTKWNLWSNPPLYSEINISGVCTRQYPSRGRLIPLTNTSSYDSLKEKERILKKCASSLERKKIK